MAYAMGVRVTDVFGFVDLPEDETDTSTSKAPWVRFDDDIPVLVTDTVIVVGNVVIAGGVTVQ